MSPSKKKKGGKPSGRAGNGKSAPSGKRPLTTEIAGVILLAAALLLLLSLIGYDSQDPSWARTVDPGYKVRNIGGRVGAWLAEAAFQGFGLTAFFLPFFMAFLGILAVLGRGRKHLFRKTAKAFLGLAILCPLLNLIFQSLTWRGAEIEPGGFFGSLLGEGLTGLLNPTGSLIVLLAAAVLFGVFATGLSLKSAFRAIGRRFSSATREVTIKLTDNRPSAKAGAARAGEVFEAAEIPDPAKKKGRARKGAPAEPLPAEPQPAPRPAPLREIKRGTIKPIKSGGFKPEPALFPAEMSSDYNFPLLTLLDAGSPPEKIDKNELMEKKRLIEDKLKEFRIEGEVREYHPGPVITTYEFTPSPGIKISQVMNLAEDLSLALRAESVRVQRLPGKASIGVEIPNNKREIIRLRDILASEDFQNSSSKLAFAMGKTVHDEVYVTDLTQMPHLLIAGATGTGKSVCLNALIASILYKATPAEVKLVLIDPKRLEFALFEGIPHLLSPIINDAKKAGFVLMDAVKRMEERLYLMGQHKVRNIQQYNQHIIQLLQEKKGTLTDEEKAKLKPLPYIVIIIDELAELMMVSGQDVDYAISRLAQLARAVGIHLILATQRPSTDVITGTIKANFATRIAFRVSSSIDSRIILDATGAEKLLGNGDMLFIPPSNPQKIRLHGAYVSNAEIRRLVKFVREQGEPEYDERIADILEADPDPEWGEDGEKDSRYEEALKLILSTGQASASYLQRRLKLGYARASRIIDQMEREGILAPADGSKPREILVDPKQYLADLRQAKAAAKNDV
ncbi:MAG: DNA translocase FtsK [Acidobacteriota bacterium]|nr:DNA translocase FtsK [Acidobacteriota bacterium]